LRRPGRGALAPDFVDAEEEFLNRFTFSRSQVLLLAWTVAALVVAEYVRHRPMADRTETVAGGVEVVAAILTGVLFVILFYRKEADRVDVSEVYSSGR
jgi:hypothetical protein